MLATSTIIQDRKGPIMKKRFLGWVLLSNGMVDLVCVVVLLVLPPRRRPLLGYQVFDSQGAFIAGGWAITTLALGIIRIWSSTRPIHFDAMKLMGLLEGTFLAVFTLIYLAVGRATIVQALLPLAVGVVFGLLYFISVVRKAEAQGAEGSDSCNSETARPVSPNLANDQKNAQI
jgi:hypothetical protein